MSELGVGDELFEGEMNDHLEKYRESLKQGKGEQDLLARKQTTLAEVEAIKSLPVVIIRNYAANFGSAAKEDLLVVLAQWAATLVENHVRSILV